MRTLKDIYICLYDMNLEAATEEYLESYESEYGPSLLLDCKTAEDVLSAIKGLVSELIDDTGEENLVREWMFNAGADADLIALCGL
jgi:hypothetical protein